MRNGGIWNESMKKFGTPIGAGPGSDRENVGFWADGTPLPVGSVDVRLRDRLRLVAGFFCLALALGAPVDDGFSLRLDPVGAGLELVEELVVVEVPLLDVLEDDEPEVEVELEGDVVVELEELLDAGVVVVDVLVVVVLVEPLAGVATQESVSDAPAGSVIGNGICPTGVPGGTFATVKVYC